MRMRKGEVLTFSGQHPLTLNGFRVMAAVPIPDSPGSRKGLRMIIVDRGATMQGRDRYVTAMHAEQDSEWMSGFYTDDYRAAVDNLYTRMLNNLPDYLALEE